MSPLSVCTASVHTDEGDHPSLLAHCMTHLICPWGAFSSSSETVPRPHRESSVLRGFPLLAAPIHLLSSSYPISPASHTVQPSCPAATQLKKLHGWSSVADTLQLASRVFSDELWEGICPPKSPASPSVMDLDMPLHALADTAFHGAASGSCKAGLSIFGNLASYQEGQLSAAARADVRLHTQ